MREVTEGKGIEIVGIIIPAAWDSCGAVTEIAISAFDESEYLIEKTEKSIRLLSLLHRQVRIKGCLVRNFETGQAVIQVHEFSLAPTRNSAKTGLQ